MRTPRRPRVRATELLVVLLAALLLVMLVAPLLGQGDAMEKARQTHCTNNLKQLATQAQIFMQENNQQLPGANWVAQSGIDSPKVLQCPSAPVDAGLTNYGYNGLLLPATAAKRPDDPGVNEQCILYTTEVGMFADAMTATPYQKPGIIGGGGLLPESRRVSLAGRHDGGVIVTFVDGHAKWCDATPVEGGLNTADPLVRAFSAGLNMGIVTNYGGGISDFTAPANLDTTRIIVGGEYCTRPIISAAAEVWRAKAGAQIIDRGFRGGRYRRYADAGLYGWADGTKPEGAAVPIGRDAVVIIVAKHSKVPDTVLRWDADGRPFINIAVLRNTYTCGEERDAGGTTAYQWYGYDSYNQTRTFFERVTGYKPADDQGKRLTVGTDAEMVERVSQDPYGLGFCSSAMVDPTNVHVVGLQMADDTIARYLGTDPKHPWLFAAKEPTGYPLSRTLYAVVVGAAGNAPNRCARVMLAPESPGMAALRKGPVFRTGYYPATWE